jgi:hypothetical protein
LAAASPTGRRADHFPIKANPCTVLPGIATSLAAYANGWKNVRESTPERLVTFSLPQPASQSSHRAATVGSSHFKPAWRGFVTFSQ